ncbi:putative PhzF superfamily epimerase YddE/YHI9 [Janthinobacterium sp. CG_23.3]|uniref:hypothetical protein n=1 Tax=Janthinobacterium sp. CG_23.3 TaxID=3349634 RepID=UPI0038D50EF3
MPASHKLLCFGATPRGGNPALVIEDEHADAAARQQLLIAAWGKERGVSGCYAYAQRADGRYEGRNFNHLDPALEDTATAQRTGSRLESPRLPPTVGPNRTTDHVKTTRTRCRSGG